MAAPYACARVASLRSLRFGARARMERHPALGALTFRPARINFPLSPKRAWVRGGRPIRGQWLAHYAPLRRRTRSAKRTNRC
jgi:hypothetical protein